MTTNWFPVSPAPPSAQKPDSRRVDGPGRGESVDDRRPAGVVAVGDGPRRAGDGTGQGKGGGRYRSETEGGVLVVENVGSAVVDAAARQESYEQADGLGTEVSLR